MEVALGIIIALQTATVGWLLYHSSQCAAFHERVARMEAEMKSVKDEIGDHDKGLRGGIHKMRAEVTPFVLWIQAEQERRNREGR